VGVAPDGPRSPFGLREIVRFRRDPLGFVSDNARRYGDLVSFRLGRGAAYQVNHPDLVRELLVTHGVDHARGPVMQRARTLMGTGLLTADDPLHAEQRRKLQPLFHRDRIAEYAQTIDAAARAAADDWRDDEPIDVRAAMLQLSLDIVGRSLFGTNLKNDGRRIAEAVNTSLPMLMDAVFLPWSDRLLRLPLPPMRRFRGAMADLDDVIDRIVREAEGANGADTCGIAGWLLQTGSGAAWRRQVRDECVTFLLAGHETVANALTFALLLVATHAAAADRIAAEAEGARACPPADRFERLSYTRAVLAESMRLYPPVWILARTLKTASTIGGHPVAPGDVIFVSQWVVQRDARFFADPLRFVPERFLESTVPKHAYFPFGAGSRQCIGEGFAWMEGTLALAEFVGRWRLSLVSEATPRLTASVTLRPAAPVRIRVTTRRAAPR